jgi:Condensation domain
MPIDHAERLKKLSPVKRALLLKASWEKVARLELSKSIPRRVIQNGSPLSFAQQRLWFIDQLEPNTPFYNIPLVLHLSGYLNVEVLERTLAEIARRHEVLRTTFVLQGDKPVQIIAPPEEIVLRLIDLSQLEEQQREAQVRLLADEEARRPFDLSHGPLWRASLLRLGEGAHVALFTMHHVVSDAWSMKVLVDEVATLYTAYLRGEGSPLPELEIQYADYACWQRQYLTDSVLEKHLAYWKKQLAGKLPVLDLPPDYPRPSDPSHRGAAKSFSLPAELSQSLRDLSNREGVTPFMLLLAAFNTLLYRYTGQDDIIIGAAIANRNRTAIEPLIGFFVNMLPIRTDLSGDPRFSELLGRVKEVALGGYAHQDIPFEKLVEEIQPEGAMRQMPLFRVAFGVQNAPWEDLKLCGIEVKPVIAEQTWVRFDLTLWMTESIKEIQVLWTYSKDLFEEKTVIRMHNHFEALLFNIVDRPDARLTTIDISSRPGTGLKHTEPGSREDSNIEKPMLVKRRGIDLSAELNEEYTGKNPSNSISRTEGGSNG